MKASELKSIAEDLGLKLVSEECGAKHRELTFENSFGVRVIRALHSGSKSSNFRDKKNSQAELRRFARGQYHGLRCIGAPQ